jgi:hypothetical protein
VDEGLKNAPLIPAKAGIPFKKNGGPSDLSLFVIV